jgi:O-antigen/teichoic acid export membrane protein
MSIGGLARVSFIYALGNGLRGLAQLVALPIFTFYLAPAEFGVIALLTVFGIVCRALFGLGFSVSTAVVYFRREDESHRADTVWTALTTSAVPAVALIGLSAAFAGPISWILTGDANHGPLVLLFAISIALQQVAYPLIWRLQFRVRPLRYIAAFSGATVVGIAVALVLVALAERGIAGWIEGMLIGSVIMVVLAVGFNRDIMRARFQMANLGEQLRLGLPIVPSLLFVFVLQSAGTYLMRYAEGGTEGVGIYGIGYSFGLAMSLAVTGFITAWTPFFQAFAVRQNNAPPAFARAHLLYTWGFGAVTLLFFVGARPAVLILTEPAYHDAYRVIGILAAAQFLIGTWSLLVPGLYFAGRTYVQTVIQGVAAAVTVGLTALLIPRAGIDGAALAMVLGTLVMCALLAVHNSTSRYAAMDYRLRPVVAALFVLGLAGGCQRVLDETLSPEAAALGSVAIVVAYVGCALALLPPSDRARLRVSRLLGGDRKT